MRAFAVGDREAGFESLCVDFWDVCGPASIEFDIVMP